MPKFGLRALAQSMARELGPKGIHVASVIIDGGVAWIPTPNLQLDLSAGKGVRGDSPSQWFAAVGKEPARYLYYKNGNRHPLRDVTTVPGAE